MPLPALLVCPREPLQTAACKVMQAALPHLHSLLRRPWWSRLLRPASAPGAAAARCDNCGSAVQQQTMATVLRDGASGAHC